MKKILIVLAFILVNPVLADGYKEKMDALIAETQGEDKERTMAIADATEAYYQAMIKYGEYKEQEYLWQKAYVLAEREANKSTKPKEECRWRPNSNAHNPCWFAGYGVWEHQITGEKRPFKSQVERLD